LTTSANSVLTDNAIDLLNKRYFRKDYSEKSWCELADRVAAAVSSAEADEQLKNLWYTTFFNMIFETKFIPSTPCLINADVRKPGQLSSCFILDVRDNIESIYAVKGECAKIFQKNGGAGLNMSCLRPKDSAVETSKGYSCGVVGFMEEYDLTADIVTRNNSRKGAIKIDLNDWHPDILEFIHCKDDITKFKRMNISVSLSNKFMNAVVNNQMWVLRFPDYSWNKEIYNNEWKGDIDDWETKGYPIKVYKEISARDLYREIMEAAWRTGEPGVSFRDTMDADNPNPHLGKIKGTNPCAEFTSIPYNSCNLGSINLAMFGETITDLEYYLGEYVPKAMRFLDNMITVNKLPLEKIDEITKGVRSVGLGVMGFADMLYILGVKYNSPEGYALASKLFSTMQNLARQTSIELAEEKGVYPLWEGSRWQQQGVKIRNSNFLSIAPTGSISFIANVSGGLEPNYALVMTRLTNEGYKYFIVNPIFEKELKKRGLYSTEILDKICANNGSCQGIKEIPEDMQKVFVTTYDMTPAEHVKMLSVIQEYVDLAASKTVNLPHSATVDDVMDVYMDAWGKGIKGITIYRDGCRDNQVLTVGKKEDKKVTINEQGYVDVEPAMEVAYGKRIKVKTGCGHLWLFFFVDAQGNLAEIWSQVSGGGCKANIESMSRLASLCFRSKVDPKHILDQLSSAFCKTSMDQVNSKSCGHVIAKNIKSFLDSQETIVPIAKDKLNQVLDLIRNMPCKLESPTDKPKTSKATGDTNEHAASLDNRCPDCGTEMQLTEGCVKCFNCGYSKCN
jgi:ribonucleoside-diphosphate reductase alpha chain